MQGKLEAGKLPLEVLSRLLTQVGTHDPRVVVGPGIGLDCAVLDLGDRYLVAKTDPITFATDRIGWYAVHVNANDVACSGARPRWFLASILLPLGQADVDLAEQIFEQIRVACTSIGASLVGGHTEVTHGIDRPLVIGCMLGEVARQDLITAAGVRPGDAVMVTAGVPIEATAIIAQEKAAELTERFDPEFLERCRNFLVEPGISVVPAARIACEQGELHAMHDPTEGGLATGLWELAEASGVALEIDPGAIPILPEGKALCQAFGLDPLGAIASGALLLSAPAGRASDYLAAFAAAGIDSAIIGRAHAASVPSVTLIKKQGSAAQTLFRPARDEITRLFS